MRKLQGWIIPTHLSFWLIMSMSMSMQTRMAMGAVLKYHYIGLLSLAFAGNAASFSHTVPSYHHDSSSIHCSPSIHKNRHHGILLESRQQHSKSASSQLGCSSSSSTDTHNEGTSTKIEPNDEPLFPDTLSLNNALYNLAKSKSSANNNKSNNFDMSQSTAQKAQDLLFQCEEWYKIHIQNGYTILQPQEYDDLIEQYQHEYDEQNNNKNNDEDDVDTKNIIEQSFSGQNIIVGPIPDTYSFSSVIDAWAKIGNSQKAFQLLRKMYTLAKEEEQDYVSYQEQQHQRSRTILPNSITYNSVINSLCNSIQQGRISTSSQIESAPMQAQELLQEMKNHIIQKTNLDCMPDTTTYNTIIKVWSQSLRKDCGYHAEELLNEMWYYHDEYQKHKNNSSNNDDNNDNQQAQAQDISNNNSNNSQQLLLDITPDQFSYSTTISAWARSSIKNHSTSAKKAELLLEQMENYRSQRGYLHLSPTTYCVNAVLNAWAKIAMNSKVSGAAHRAERILKRMEALYDQSGGEELRPNTISYNTVISAYARSGEVGSERRAERILRRMDAISNKAAEEEHQEHEQKYGQKNSCHPDLISYNTVINAWSRSRASEAPNRAEAILNHMEKQYKNGLSNIQPDVVSYTSCIAAWARSKTQITPDMAYRAQSILDRMDEAFRSGNVKAKPTVLSYNTVCNAWAKSRDENAASQVLSILEKMETMYSNGEMYVKPDIFTYTTCIDALAKQGTKESTEKALELLSTIEERYNKTSDEDIKPNVRTYTSCINAISRSKLGPQRAEALLSRMEGMGKMDKDLIVDVVCFNAVLNAWGWSSEPHKARYANEIFQKMLHLYKSRENVDAKPDLITINSLLNACAFSNVEDEEESTEAVEIAISAYELYQSEAPLYGVPNHLTYGTMLMIFNKLLPKNEVRDDLMKNLFYQCCDKGHVSGFVVSQLHRGFNEKALKELFGKAAVNDGVNLVIDKRKVPRDWSRYAGGRSRPSKKKKLADVTKQQISRSPIR